MPSDEVVVGLTLAGLVGLWLVALHGYVTGWGNLLSLLLASVLVPVNIGLLALLYRVEQLKKGVPDA